METSLLERRKAPRFQGKLKVEMEKGNGITRDFSASGVYFETDLLFSPLDPIRFSLNLEHSNIAHLVQVRCLGRVVRVEPKGERMGVAVSIHSFSFWI